MHHKSVTKRGAFAAMVLVFIGVIMMPFAIVVLSSYPDDVRPLGVILLVCSIIVLLGAIRTLSRSSRKLIKDREGLKHRPTNSAAELPVEPNQVLADWICTNEEWKSFIKWEHRNKKWYLPYGLLFRSIIHPGNSANTIIITNNFVVINNKLYRFADKDRWIGEVKIDEEYSPKILQITYHNRTRRGTTRDEINVPIPKGKLGEAVMLMSKIVSREA